LQPLLASGCRVTGIDISEAMLARARTRLQGLPGDDQARASLVQADMTKLPLSAGHFGLVLIPYNTFLHLGPDDALAACRAARRQLQPGGRLLLDLINPATVTELYEEQGMGLETILNQGDDVVLVFSSSHVRQTAQILEITWIYDKSPRSGGAVQRSVVEMVYHYYYPHQLELMLEQSGVRLGALYGGYDGSEYSEESERLLVVGEVGD
jgi:SAM-dependent methyltransferase